MLVEGKKIVAIGPNLQAGDADEIDARGRIVMPGFIDTHHHQFETALRSFLADGILINDGSGSPSADHDLLRVHPAQIRARCTGRRTSTSTSCSAAWRSSTTASPRCTTSRRSITRRSTRTRPSRRCSIPGAAPPSAISRAPGRASQSGNQYPADATRIKKQWFSSSDQLVHMIMGGEVYLGDATTQQSWTIGRQLGLQIAAHILSPFGIRPIMDDARRRHGRRNNNIGIGPDNLFIHMTGMSDIAWQKVKDVGAQVSIAFPIEMNMRHGMPPILKMQSLGIEPSLSRGRRVHHDGGLLHPDALAHEHAAHGGEPDDPRAGKFHAAEPVADTGARHAAAAQQRGTCCATPP